MAKKPTAKAATREKVKKTESKPKAPAKKSSGEKMAPLHFPTGVLLGAHTSTSGGVTQSVPRAQACGFTAAQIFVKNNKQWFAPPLAEEEIKQFRSGQKASGIYFFAHNSYLVNLASQDAQMFSTSVKAMIGELER